MGEELETQAGLVGADVSVAVVSSGAGFLSTSSFNDPAGSLLSDLR